MKAKIGEVEIESNDLLELNKKLLKHNFSDVSLIFGDYFNSKVELDLINQTIKVNNEQVKLDCEKLTDVRWIHFKRHKIEFRMDGGKVKSFKYGIGFQGNLNNENVQRFVLIDETGYTLEKKK